MSKTKGRSGFTVVELLISLFIASAFLLSGYQLFNVAVKDSGESRAQTIATNLAYEYLQRYKFTAITPCVESTPFNNSVIITGLTNATVTVSITCPYASVNTVSKITTTVQFNTPTKAVKIATYVKL